MKISIYDSEFLLCQCFGVLETRLGNKIIKISDKFETNISIGEEVECFSSEGVITKKTISEIIQHSESSYILRYNRKNLACKYVLPALFENRDRINYKTHIINTYVNSDRTKIYVEALYDEYLDDVLINTGSFRNIVSKDWSYVYEYSVPAKFKEDLNLIIEGKYSKISDTYKSIIMSFTGNTLVQYLNEPSYMVKPKLQNQEDVSTLNKIFIRSKELRNKIEKQYGIPVGVLDPTQELDSLFKENEFKNFN